MRAVIPSEVENGAAREAATSTGRRTAERAGSERIKSLDSSEKALDPSSSRDITEPLFAALNVCNDAVPHSASMNMSIDEALLESASIPTIRVYRWHSPALSFGYFGKFADVAIHAVERDLVRRWTGGGIVFHGDDLTYSIVIPPSDPTFDESSIALYEKIHHALADTLNGVGKRAFVTGSVDPAGIALSKHPAVNASGYNCFANPVRADVMIDGRKIAGAAQRRDSFAVCCSKEVSRAFLRSLILLKNLPKLCQPTAQSSRSMNKFCSARKNWRCKNTGLNPGCASVEN